MVVGNNLNIGSAKLDESDSGSSNSRPKTVKTPDADGKHGAEEMTRPGKRGISKSESELEPTQPAAAPTVTEKKRCVEFNISDSSDNVSIESASTSTPTPPITPVKLSNAAKPKAKATSTVSGESSGASARSGNGNGMRATTTGTEHAPGSPGTRATTVVRRHRVHVAGIRRSSGREQDKADCGSIVCCCFLMILCFIVIMVFTACKDGRCEETHKNTRIRLRSVTTKKNITKYELPINKRELNRTLDEQENFKTEMLRLRSNYTILSGKLNQTQSELQFARTKFEQFKNQVELNFSRVVQRLGNMELRQKKNQQLAENLEAKRDWDVGRFVDFKEETSVLLHAARRDLKMLAHKVYGNTGDSNEGPPEFGFFCIFIVHLIIWSLI